MVTLQDLRRWKNRLRNGDNDYMLIAKDCESNTWQLIFNKSVTPIKHIEIEADAYGDGHAFVYDYTYDVESTPDFWCALLIKRGGEFLCKDCSGVHGFLNGEDAPLSVFRVCFQTEDYEFNYKFKNFKTRITTYNLHKYCGNDDDPSAKGDWLWE